MTGGGSTTNYIYDYKNQLLRVESSGTQVEFMYDALGRRVQKKAIYPSSSATTKYVYDGNQVIEERDGANLLKSRYAYGNGIDEPVEIEKANTAGAMTSYLPMQDTNGNVIALADNTGKLIEKVNYSAYGAPTFIYDHVAPQVDQVRIISGKINIRFSEAVDQTSAKSAIKVKQGTNDLSGAITFSEDDKSAVFAPSSVLPNASLTVVIATDLEDKNNNKLAVEFSQSFTYAGSDLMVYDRVAPEVEKITLLSGKIYVAFSEELDPASIASAIGLTYTNGTINGTSILDNPKTILFTPSSSLSNSTEYTVTVKSTVKDLSGKSLTQFSEKFIYSGSDLLIFKKLDPTEHAESFIKNTTLFQGRTLDPETGLYYFRNRYLFSEIGRFLQRDKKGFNDSMNPYQSFGNNPVNFTDPMGTLSVKKWLLGAAEGFVNFGVGLGSMINPQMLPIRSSVNFTDPKKPIFVNELDTRSELDKLADVSIVKPMADFLVDVSTNVWFGLLEKNINPEMRDEYQQGLSRNIGQVGGMVLTAKAMKAGTRGSTPKVPATWNEFQSATKGMFKSRADAGMAWKFYENGAETAYRAINPAYADSTMKSGQFYKSGSAGRLGNDGIYANSTVEGAIAEYQYHNPGIKPAVFKIEYPVSPTLTIDPPPSGYFSQPLPFTQGTNVLMAPSLRTPGTFNLLIRKGAVPVGRIQ